MAKLRDKLKNLDSCIRKNWERIDSQKGLSTKDKLEKLVNSSLKRDRVREKRIYEKSVGEGSAFIIRDFFYPLNSVFGNFELSEWRNVSSESLSIISGDDELLNVSPKELLFFDTETTGISGGTGTIPFMLGFGFFEEKNFLVKIFVLNDPSKEDEFLNEVDSFLNKKKFSGTVTYNGKSFDFPLMETRYILYRKRFPLLTKPHIDFLFPARMIWKNTYETRKLGYLGDCLLGISRDEDIDGSQIPMLYFSYLRSQSFSLIEKVIRHNALDIVGLSALLLLGIKYLEDVSNTSDEGEILGTAMIHERHGNFDKAIELYGILKESAVREDIVSKAVKKLSLIKKKKKLYNEASELWMILSNYKDHLAYRELSVHYEHREKDYFKAIKFVEKGLETINLTEVQRNDLKKRLNRLKKKVEKLEKEVVDIKG